MNKIIFLLVTSSDPALLHVRMCVCVQLNKSYFRRIRQYRTAGEYKSTRTQKYGFTSSALNFCPRTTALLSVWKEMT